MITEDVREGLATALSAIPGLHTPAIMQQAHAPCAIIELDRVKYHDTMEITDAEWRMTVTLIVSNNDVVAAQKALDTYLASSGDGSIRGAIEADPTLGGLVTDCTVMEARDVGLVTISGEPYRAAIFEVQVS